MPCSTVVEHTTILFGVHRGYNLIAMAYISNDDFQFFHLLANLEMSVVLNSNGGMPAKPLIIYATMWCFFGGIEKTDKRFDQAHVMSIL